MYIGAMPMPKKIFKEDKKMKSSGAVRKIDQLGRITIPRGIMNAFEIKLGDPLEIFTEGERIVLRKYNPGCYSCGKITELHEICGIKICKECAAIVADTLELWRK